MDLQLLVGPERSDMPIIFISGHGDVPMSVKAMKAGAVEFLTKPFGEEVLRDAMPRRSNLVARGLKIGPVFSTTYRVAPVAIGTTKHNEARLITAKFPQGNQPLMRIHEL